MAVCAHMFKSVCACVTLIVGTKAGPRHKGKAIPFRVNGPVKVLVIPQEINVSQL